MQDDISIAERIPLDLNDSEQVRLLWEAYYPRMKRVVAQRAKFIRSAVADESQIALSAFNSYVEGAREGRFACSDDQDETWRLLKTIAIRKANDTRKTLQAKKRGGTHKILGQADSAADAGTLGAVDSAPGFQPGPSLDMEVADLFNCLLERLPDDRHRDVVLLKLQGASVAEIAECLATTTRTVQRLVKKIELDWQAELLNTPPQ